MKLTRSCCLEKVTVWARAMDYILHSRRLLTSGNVTSLKVHNNSNWHTTHYRTEQLNITKRNITKHNAHAPHYLAAHIRSYDNPTFHALARSKRHLISGTAIMPYLFRNSDNITTMTTLPRCSISQSSVTSVMSMFNFISTPLCRDQIS